MSGTTWNDTTRSLAISGATVTSSSPVVDFSQTWNAAGQQFIGKTTNITDTASAVISQLERWQANGADRVSFRKDGTIRFASGRLEFEDANGFISRTAASNSMQFAPSVGSPMINLSNSECNVLPEIRLGQANGSQITQSLRAYPRSNNTGDGHNLRVKAGDGHTLGIGTRGGNLELTAGDAFGTGNNQGGDLHVFGGLSTGSGSTGAVNLGYTGSAARGLVRCWTNLDFQSTTRPVNVPNPIASTDGSNKAYVDARTPRITVGTTAPVSPALNDIWIDTN